MKRLSRFFLICIETQFRCPSISWLVYNLTSSSRYRLPFTIMFKNCRRRLAETVENMSSHIFIPSVPKFVFQKRQKHSFSGINLFILKTMFLMSHTSFALLFKKGRIRFKKLSIDSFRACVSTWYDLRGHQSTKIHYSPFFTTPAALSKVPYISKIAPVAANLPIWTRAF